MLKWHSHREFILLAAAMVIALAESTRAADQAASNAAPRFESHVRPILKAHCFQCHGDDGQSEAGLDLRLVRSMSEGGDSGPALVPGKSSASLILERLRAGEMPPGEKKVPDEEIATIARWIDSGAKTARPEPAAKAPAITDEELAHWSFQPITRPAVPTVKHTAAVTNAIDAFLLERLEREGLEFSQQADRVALVRRAYFDLWGASVAMAWLMNEERLRGAPAKPDFEQATFDLLPKRPPHTPRAKAVISLFMQGGPSHVDLFDPKPELKKYENVEYGRKLKYGSELENARNSRTLFPSPWNFQRAGKCGMELSELLPALQTVADDICLIRSMHTSVNNHDQSIMALNTGRPTAGRPSLGSWVTYALGTENQDLPAYVVLTDPRGLPVRGLENWSNAWLPSLYQGTVIRPKEPRILNLDPPAHLAGVPQRQLLDYLDRLNQDHLAQHPGEADLAARLASYELAARMQTTAKEAVDLAQESEATRKMYGLDDPVTRHFGERCLLARRLVERGVRFVQVCTGNQSWDHHGDIRNKLPENCKIVDKPCAALINDLKQRGLLDTTLVQWGGEMGRMPAIEQDQGSKVGRDHNTFGFSMWLAGGGVKRGLVYGATDEVGSEAVENGVSHSDYHATLLHLLGLDYEDVVFQRANGPGSLVDGQPARVVHEILA
ncbi:MAG TPA: DUF1501 domain-containing protein [Pirellulales bacterium]|jgi:mono/diheme cytochrome c family protein|nr:DUF1501 domain-containing protein [Pirellulales bacterium]